MAPLGCLPLPAVGDALEWATMLVMVWWECCRSGGGERLGEVAVTEAGLSATRQREASTREVLCRLSSVALTLIKAMAAIATSALAARGRSVSGGS